MIRSGYHRTSPSKRVNLAILLLLALVLIARFGLGWLSFAGFGENSRYTNLFISLAPVRLGRSPWEVPFGKVVEGMSVVDDVFLGYKDSLLHKMVQRNGS